MYVCMFFRSALRMGTKSECVADVKGTVSMMVCVVCAEGRVADE